MRKYERVTAPLHVDYNGKFYDKKTGQGYFAFVILSFYFFINKIVEVG
jgi:hypothetical protein